MRINRLVYVQIFCSLKGKKIKDCCRQVPLSCCLYYLQIRIPDLYFLELNLDF